MSSFRLLVLAIGIGMAFTAPSYAAEKNAMSITRFECKHFATNADFDKSDLPLAFSFDVVGDPFSLDSEWTMVRLDGQTATAETFAVSGEALGGMLPAHGSLGLKVMLPDKQLENIYLMFGQEIPNGAINFWLGFGRPNFYQSPGYGCDNEKALAAGAVK